MSKTAVITGTSGGLGRIIANEFKHHHYKTIGLGGRNDTDIGH